MSETLFKFLLSEIKTIRITCERLHNGQPCGGIAEIPVDRLGQEVACPVCRNAFPVGLDGNSLEPLQRVIKTLAALRGKIGTVEIVVPAPETK
jgi:hypothetical protein